MQQIQQHDFQSTVADPTVTITDLATIIRRRLWLVILIVVVCVFTAGIVSKRTPKAWQANAALLLVQHAPAMTTTTQSVSAAPMVESIDTQISLLESSEIAKRAGQTVGVNNDIIAHALTVTAPKDGDNVINLMVEADSREHAIAWTDAICNAFIDYKQEVARQNSQDVLDTLAVQASKAQSQMQIADQAVLNFKTANHLIDVPTQTMATLNAYLTQSAAVTALKGEYSSAQSRASSYDQLLRQADQQIKNSTGVRDDSLALSLQAKLNDLEMQRVQIAQSYKTTFPGKLTVLDAQIADTKKRLQASIQSTAASANPSLQAQDALEQQARQADLDATYAAAKLHIATNLLGQLRQQTVNLPQITIQADRLTQASQAAHELYNSLESNLHAAQIVQDEASGNVQVVQTASAPLDPVRPSPKRDLLVGAGIGIFLSLVAVLLLEQSDRSVRGIADVRRLVGGPVAAALPLMTRRQRAQFLNGEEPPLLIETCNAARANIGLAMRLQTSKDIDDHGVILVSSTVSGEGKSIMAFELARSYARAGRRTILVNADMRRPSQLSLLRSEKEPKSGLAEVLAGELAVEDALIGADIHNLWVMHSGQADRNPVDLISLPGMAATVEALRTAADVVIIDSPPATVADALLLAPYADCVLFVIGVGMADGERVRAAAAGLSNASPKIMAYLVNRVPQNSTQASDFSRYGRPYAPLPAPPVTNDHLGSRTMLLQRDPDNGLSELKPVVNGVASSPQSTHGERPTMRVLPDFGTRLTALEGPYAGQAFAISAGKPLMLGAAPDCDIVFARDGTISQRHARILPEPGGHVLLDNGSTNGTLVNGVPIVRQVLAVGDLVILGNSRFRYE